MENFIEQYKKFKTDEVALTVNANKIINFARLSSIANEDGIYKTNRIFIRDYDENSYHLIGIKDNDGNVEFVCEDDIILTKDEISWETLIQIACELSQKIHIKK